MYRIGSELFQKLSLILTLLNVWVLLPKITCIFCLSLFLAVILVLLIQSSKIFV